MNDPFQNVPMPTGDAWNEVIRLAYTQIFECGHPRGGCTACNTFVKIMKIARERRLADEGRLRVDPTV